MTREDFLGLHFRAAQADQALTFVWWTKQRHAGHALATRQLEELSSVSDHRSAMSV